MGSQRITHDWVTFTFTLFSSVLGQWEETAMAPHSSTPAWKIPWTEEPGGLQSIGLRRVRHDWATSLSHIGEGNDIPLHCSCLENPRDGEPGGLPYMGSHRVRHDWSNLAAAAAGQWEPFLMSKTFMYPLIMKFVILAIYCEFKCLGGCDCKMMKPGLLSSRQGKRLMCVFGRLIRLSLEEDGSIFCLYPQPSHVLFKMLSDELGRINLKVFFTGTLQWSYRYPPPPPSLVFKLKTNFFEFFEFGNINPSDMVHLSAEGMHLVWLNYLANRKLLGTFLVCSDCPAKHSYYPIVSCLWLIVLSIWLKCHPPGSSLDVPA